MNFFSLKYKLLLFSLMISILLTGVSSLVEITYSLRTYTTDLDTDIQEFFDENSGFIARKIWILDYPSVLALAANQLRGKRFDRIIITDIQKEKIVDLGDPVRPRAIEREFDLTYVHNKKNTVIGHIFIAGNIPTYGEMISGRWASLFLTNGLFIAIIFFFSFVVFHRTVMRHLLDITRFTELQDSGDRPFGNLYELPAEKTRDEISLLVDALNRRSRRIAEEFSRRKQTEHVLKQQNERLTQEVHQRQRMEKTILDTEEKYRLLVEHANDAIFIAQDGVAKFPNPKTIELTGYTAEEMAAMPFTDIIHPEDRSMVLERYKRRLQGETLLNTYAFKIISKTGDIRTVQINSVLIEWEKRPATLNFIRDISNQTYLEEQIRQSHKMEAIGTLTGGIAHDFNNLLGIIIGNLELAVETVPDRNPARYHLDEVMTASFRARDVVSRLLSFSRKTDISRKALDLRSVIQETVLLLRSSIPTSIDIQYHLPEAVPAINADATQIQQVILNLCTNAAHAMETEGGILTLRLETILPDTKGFPSPLKPLNRIRLTVTDTGSGMTSDILKKVFDPYFTTKEIGKGTGMGLAVVHGIVKSHDGDITIESTPGKGTVVSLVFPAIDDHPENDDTPDRNPPMGRERILFVDDEPSITRMAKVALERLGYDVTVLSDSLEALDMFRNTPDEFDLVITDMTMPGLTGDKLAGAIRSVRPDIPVILCTGYSSRMNEDTARAAGFNAFIYKPIVVLDLAETIRSVLDAIPAG